MVGGRFRRRVGVAAVVALVAAGCSWGQYGHDASRVGWSPLEDVITPANVTSLAPLWSGPSTAIGARLANGSIFSVQGPFSGPQRLIAYDAAGAQNCSGTPRTCAPKWSANLSLRIGVWSPYDGIAVEGDRVYVVGWVPFFAGPWKMEVFDANGRQNCSGTPVVCAPLWSATWGVGAENDHRGPRVAVAGSQVYVSTPANPSSVSVFDAAGIAGCTTTAPRQCSSLYTTGGPLISGGFSVGDGKLVVNTAGVAVYDAAGVEGCSNGVCQPLFLAADQFSPSIAGGRIYSPGTAFELASGPTCVPPMPPFGCAPSWRMRLASDPLRSPPVVAAGQVYIGESILGQPTADIEVFDAAGVAGCSGTPRVCMPQARLVHGASTLAVSATKSLVFATTAATQQVDRPRLHAFALASPTTCTGSVPRTCPPLWSADLRLDSFSPNVISIANGIVVVSYDGGSFDVFALRT
jgi:hypothetical protein